VHLETNLLIEPDAAANYEAEVRAAEEAKRKTDEAKQPHKPGDPSKAPVPSAGQPTKRANKRFYGTVNLDPLLAKKQFAEIIDEVVQNFTTRPNDIVSIVVEIQAVAPAGFDDGIQRTVKENCNALKFRASGFEPESDELDATHSSSSNGPRSIGPVMDCSAGLVGRHFQ